MSLEKNQIEEEGSKEALNEEFRLLKTRANTFDMKIDFTEQLFCELWIHIKCNNLNYLDYRYLQICDESWYCIDCCSTIFPLLIKQQTLPVLLY